MSIIEIIHVGALESLVCRPLCGLDRGPYRLPGLKAGPEGPMAST
jgi:hypothetical protein